MCYNKPRRIEPHRHLLELGVWALFYFASKTNKANKRQIKATLRSFNASFR